MMHRRSRLGVKVGNEEDHLEDNVDDVEDDERLLALPLRVPLVGRLEMLVFELIRQIEQENSWGQMIVQKKQKSAKCELKKRLSAVSAVFFVM